MTTPATPRARVRLGKIYADQISFQAAVDEIVRLAKNEIGGYVVTPNVDHVVLADTRDDLVACYADAALSLVDGMPLVWLSHALREPFPEKISGSDLAEPLLARAADEGLPVTFLGAAPGVGQVAKEKMEAKYPGLDVVATICPPLGFEKDPEQLAVVIDAVKQSQAALVFVALGCPKQELFMHAHAQALSPAVLLGIGATLDFLAGHVQRAPRVVSQIGMEWVWRLAKEPRRMAQRYLVQDRKIGKIALQTLRAPRRNRAFLHHPPEANGDASSPERIS